MREPGGDMPGLDAGGAGDANSEPNTRVAVASADAKPAVAVDAVSEASVQTPVSGDPVPSWTVPRIRDGERVPVQWGAPVAATSAEAPAAQEDQAYTEAPRAELAGIANQAAQSAEAQPGMVAGDVVAEGSSPEPDAAEGIAAEVLTPDSDAVEGASNTAEPVDAVAETPATVETPVAAAEAPAAQPDQSGTETSPTPAEATALIEFTPDMAKSAKVDALVQRMLGTSSQEYAMWKMFQGGASNKDVCTQFGVEPNTLRNLNQRIRNALSGINFQNISSAETAPVIIPANAETIQTPDGQTFITQKALAERFGLDVKVLRGKIRSGLESGQIGKQRGLAGTGTRTLVNEDQAMRFLANNRSVPGLEQQSAEGQPGQDAVAEQPAAQAESTEVTAETPAEAPETTPAAPADTLKPAA